MKYDDGDIVFNGETLQEAPEFNHKNMTWTGDECVKEKFEKRAGWGEKFGEKETIVPARCFPKIGAKIAPNESIATKTRSE